MEEIIFIGSSFTEGTGLEYAEYRDLIQKRDNISLSKENEKELLMYVTGNIGLIIPQGDRYKIFDATSLSAIAGGNADNNACKYDTTFKMKIMPNYMNIIYT